MNPQTNVHRVQSILIKITHNTIVNTACCYCSSYMTLFFASCNLHAILWSYVLQNIPAGGDGDDFNIYISEGGVPLTASLFNLNGRFLGLLIDVFYLLI